MNEERIYDIPTRVFHWLFALLFVVAFTIGNTVDDDSSIFSYHMLSGIVLCFLVLLRVLWGLLGTKYARFSGFPLNPRELLNYFKGVLTGDSRKWAGHNPASSWAAMAMMLLALGLGVTGYLMSSGKAGENLEEAHELLANGFLIVVLLHLAGIVLHSIRHRDGIWESMFSGRKSGIPEQASQINSYSSVGVLLLAATIAFSSYLVQNFDGKNRNVTLFGTKLNLGEAADDEHAYRKGKGSDDSHKKRPRHEEDDD